MDDEKTTEAPLDNQIENLIQIVAVLLDRVGGEIVISRKDFEMYEGVPVVGRQIGKGYIMLRLADEDEAYAEDSAEKFPPDFPS